MSSLAISEGGRASFSACAADTPIERLPVERTDYHEPVMVAEVLTTFAECADGVIIDATLGGGGHSARLLAAMPTIRILGIDRDPAARAQASTVLAPYAGRWMIAASTFASIADVVANNQDWLAGAPIVGVLMDLGVSSHQLDEASRGF